MLLSSRYVQATDNSHQQAAVHHRFGQPQELLQLPDSVQLSLQVSSQLELAFLHARELRIELPLERFQLEMQELHLSCPPGGAVQLHGCIQQAAAAPAESTGHIAESTPSVGGAAMWIAR